ncbi:efflux RND transporter periplasmic adaptor subunit, partial [Acinetobacter baumannii]
AQTSLTRWQNLRQKDAVSQQELDERTSTANQAHADLAAADANVRRLQELQGFRRVVAPFAGVVTKRNVDVGTLVNAGNAG